VNVFKKSWTADEADRWTIHDFLACVFGVLAFFLVNVGVAGSILLQPWGFVCLALSVVFTWMTFKVIDPKLRTLSDAFEEKQAGYLEGMERRNRWEREHGD
jgi:peptidoglycan/LPS O-acetylase OafA/YrhL